MFVQFALYIKDLDADTEQFVKMCNSAEEADHFVKELQRAGHTAYYRPSFDVRKISFPAFSASELPTHVALDLHIRSDIQDEYIQSVFGSEVDDDNDKYAEIYEYELHAVFDKLQKELKYIGPLHWGLQDTYNYCRSLLITSCQAFEPDITEIDLCKLDALALKISEECVHESQKGD